MQKQPFTSCSRNTNIEKRASLDIALTKPDDVELFYTASLHFLKQRLNEKKVVISAESNQTTQCKQSSENPQTSTTTPGLKSLSMHQILPYPKSKRESFLARVMNSFRKYRKYNDIAENRTDDIEMLNTISNYKFQHCERFSQVYSSHLKAISEEASKQGTDKDMQILQNLRQYSKRVDR
ncbi:unnamed protein product [Euphydryas editha]|uniref:Uncharacterized protein n=1 Tax=Euphydryas editha TaxID=104508 RepID=A0AAU9UXN4_EUPED|nr:unnamed protein product [Euphydryas editha]